MNEQRISQLEKELSSLIGLNSVKEEVQRLSNFIKVQQMRKQCGLMTTPISYHCVFTGNPGTGKTTVARILAGIFKELGILDKGHLVETDRSGLVAEYVGQTAVKTNKVIDSAMDGVLFIDEAYSLAQGGQNDFGTEAISTLLKRMEDDRNRLIVILAGYGNEMKQFIDTNPGLQSRFNRYIEFPDYSVDELLEIFMRNIFKHDYSITENAKSQARKVIEIAYAEKDKNFGNARFIRNLFEKTLENQAMRLVSESNIDRNRLILITQSDLCTDSVFEDDSPIITGKQESNKESLEPYNPCLDLPYYKKPILSPECSRNNTINSKNFTKKRQEGLSFYDLYKSTEFQKSSFKLPCIIGSDNQNECIVTDLSYNNILICHSDYRICIGEIFSIVISLLCKMHPAELKFFIINTDKEDFNALKKLQNHFLASEYKDYLHENSAINNTNKEKKIKSLLLEMIHRQELFEKSNIDNISDYNEAFIKRMLSPEFEHAFLPYLVFVLYYDELSMDSINHLLPILTRGKKYGIHVLLFSNFSNVYTPIKLVSNLSDIIITNNISFLKDSNSNNTKNITDKVYEILGKDYEEIHTSNPSDDNINDVINFISNQIGYTYSEGLPEVDEDEIFINDYTKTIDPLFEKAAQIIVSNQHGSTSLLQRRLDLKFRRANKLMDKLEKAGIVGPSQGPMPRTVKVSSMEELNKILNSILNR